MVENKVVMTSEGCGFINLGRLEFRLWTNNRKTDQNVRNHHNTRNLAVKLSNPNQAVTMVMRTSIQSVSSAPHTDGFNNYLSVTCSKIPLANLSNGIYQVLKTKNLLSSNEIKASRVTEDILLKSVMNSMKLVIPLHFIT